LLKWTAASNESCGRWKQPSTTSREKEQKQKKSPNIGYEEKRRYITVQEPEDQYKALSQSERKVVQRIPKVTL